MKYQILAWTTAALGLGAWFSTSVATWTYHILLATFALLLAGVLGHVQFDTRWNDTFLAAAVFLCAFIVGVQSPQLPRVPILAVTLVFFALSIWRGEV